MSNSAPLRIMCYPWQGAGSNPYQRLFYEALEPAGVSFVGEPKISDAWLRENAHRLDAIHFHWPEDCWRSGKQSIATRFKRLAGFWRYLRLARRLGLRLIWTVHNLEHHEGATAFDRLGYRVLATQCDLLICHSETSARALRARHGSLARVVVMPHGTYDGIYPVSRGRDEVIGKFGLRPGLPLVCCVGAIRTYKGLDIAIESVKRLRGTVQLLIAGRAHSKNEIEALQERAVGAPDIKIVARELDDREFADVVAASEAVLLPYREITGSGALMAAWTLGRGVVASDLPFFREMCEKHPGTGRLFATGDPAALAAAIRDYMNVPAQRRADAVLEAAANYRWEKCIVPVADVISKWREENSRAVAMNDSGLVRST